MLITMTALLVVLALGVYGLGRYGPGGYALAGRPGGEVQRGSARRSYYLH